MNNRNDRSADDSEDSMRALLELGSPRLQPPVQDAHDIREAVHAEWRRLTPKPRRRNQVMYWAMAASIAIALFLTTQTPHVPATPVLVATVEKSFGEISVRRTATADRSLANQAAINLMTGQTIVTGVDSAMALSWATGGSLRLDRETQLLLVSPTTVRLLAGRIYFDSGSSAMGNSGQSSFKVNTPFAVVEHVGTQFMTSVFDDSLTVSVREGAVSINGSRYDATASAGQRVEIQADGRYSLNKEPGYGAEWQWIESIAPMLNPKGRTVLDFLNWVSRESGRSLKFESQRARLIASSAELRAPVLDEPTRALKIFLQTTDLKAETVDDVISVRVATASE